MARRAFEGATPDFDNHCQKGHACRYGVDVMQSPEALTDLFRANGRKMTAQRQCIFRALEGDVTHPSAEHVHEKVRREMPNVSLKTVYQTLNDLAELGADLGARRRHRFRALRSQCRHRAPPPGLSLLWQGA